jgi:hypothetical protein
MGILGGEGICLCVTACEQGPGINSQLGEIDSLESIPSLEESIHWDRFLGHLNFYKWGF